MLIPDHIRITVDPIIVKVTIENDPAIQMQIDDLKIVLDQLGFNYRFATEYGEVHYQDICPACRRRLLALNQGKTLGR